MADVLPVSVGRRHALKRAAAAVAAGVVAYLVAMPFVPWQAAVLIGWDGMALVIVGAVVVETWGRDAAATAALATREDDSKAAAELLLMAASVVSLAGVGFGLVKAGQEDGYARAGITVVIVLSVFLAWGVVQTVFMLRYARLYYGGPVGGIEFNEDDPPDYRDFRYLALTVGMFAFSSDGVPAEVAFDNFAVKTLPSAPGS